MVHDPSRPLERVRIVVGSDDEGLRLDHFLMDRVSWRSRTELQGRVRKGQILVNGAVVKAATRLRAGDEVLLIVQKQDLPDQDPSTIDLCILHEDEDLVVLNKQPGLIVHPTGGHVLDTIISALFLRYRLMGEAARDVVPQVVHRLDRNTSGVLVLAKSAAAKRVLQEQFEGRRPEKRYVAVVAGGPAADTGEIDAPLTRDLFGEIKIRMKVAADGLPSRTGFEVVERFADSSLVRCRLFTGRQHQIRVHCAHAGFPLHADPLYGDPRDVGFHEDEGPVLRRQALHAESMEIEHPRTGATIRFFAPLPEDLDRFIAGLRAGRRVAHFDDHQSATWRRA